MLPGFKRPPTIFSMRVNDCRSNKRLLSRCSRFLKISLEIFLQKYRVLPIHKEVRFRLEKFRRRETPFLVSISFQYLKLFPLPSYEKLIFVEMLLGRQIFQYNNRFMSSKRKTLIFVRISSIKWS